MPALSSLSPSSVYAAYAKLKDSVERTPVLTSSTLSAVASAEEPEVLEDKSSSVELFFKAENLQKTGSFKFRGALNSAVSLSDTQLARGLATTSSGNHAKALAAAAAQLAVEKGFPIPVFAVMPENAVAAKMDAVESYGGIVIRSGRSWEDRAAVLSAVCDTTGATLISSDTNPNILLGQGTVGIEFLEQVKLQHGGHGLDCVVAPCGTGGMLSGLALALHDTPVKLFGVEPADGGDDAARGRASGEHIRHVETSSIADGLRSPVGALAWEIIKHKELVEDIVSVTDEEILAAVRLVAHELKVIIEPSAAVGLAAALFNPDLRRAFKGMRQPCRVGVVFSGGNIAMDTLGSILAWGGNAKSV